jgi:hypothetical protein
MRPVVTGFQRTISRPEYYLAFCPLFFTLYGKIRGELYSAEKEYRLETSRLGGRTSAYSQKNEALRPKKYPELSIENGRGRLYFEC